jgi:hypothetical protein
MVLCVLPTWNINRIEEEKKENEQQEREREREGAPMVICCRSFPLGARSIVKINKEKKKEKEKKTYYTQVYNAL